MSEVPKQTPPREKSPAWLRTQEHLQGMNFWHLAYKCPGCGFVQSAELLRKAGGISYDEIERDLRARHTCNHCGRSVIASKGDQPATLDARLVIVERCPMFEPATPEEARALKESWSK